MQVVWNDETEARDDESHENVNACIKDDLNYYDTIEKVNDESHVVIATKDFTE